MPNTAMQQKIGLMLFLGWSSWFLSSCVVPESRLSTASSPSPVVATPLASPVPTAITARFEIVTNGTRRIFTDAKYHNQSEEVYIESSDPNLIQIKMSDITWDDFFSTLPFSLTRDCLVTGTQQTFCNSESKKLYFILNGQDTPDALDRIIAPDDMLRVEYR